MTRASGQSGPTRKSEAPVELLLTLVPFTPLEPPQGDE